MNNDQTNEPALRQDEPQLNTIQILDENLRRGFAQVPRPVLRAEGLSAKAKLVYIELLDYAWQSGSCFPGQQRIAEDLDVSVDTVQRALMELRAFGLIDWKRRGLNKPNVYYILRLGDNPKLDLSDPGSRNLRFQEAAEMRHQDTAAKRQEKYSAKDTQMNSVNGDKKEFTEEGDGRSPGGLKPISAILEAGASRGKPSSRRDWLAQEMVAATGDRGSLGCYRAIAERCDQQLVFEALALLREAQRDGSIRQSRGALFVGIVRRLCQERGLGDPLMKAARYQSNRGEVWRGGGAPSPGEDTDQRRRSEPTAVGEILNRRSRATTSSPGNGSQSPVQAPKTAANPGGGANHQPTLEKPARRAGAHRPARRKVKVPESIRALMEQWSALDFHDEAHAPSNVSQVANVFRASGLSESAFIAKMYEARKITQQRATTIRKKAEGSEGQYNRAPYFFACLRDLLRVEDEQERASQGAPAG